MVGVECLMARGEESDSMEEIGAVECEEAPDTGF
jgi:hypothetical protein